MNPPAASSKTEAFSFQGNEQEWIRLKWQIIRDAMQTADKAIDRWRRLSAEVNDYLDRKGITDMVQRSKIRGENLSLGEALSTCDWYRAEAQVHMDDLSLYLRLKERGLL